jgi:hypothetical protein
VDNAARWAVHTVQWDPELAAVGFQLCDLPRRHLVLDGNVRRRRGTAVIYCRHCLKRATHAYSTVAQSLESLWGRDLMNQVQIDVEHSRATGFLHDNMIGPDFFEKGPRFWNSHWFIPRL